MKIIKRVVAVLGVVSLVSAPLVTSTASAGGLGLCYYKPWLPQCGGPID